MFQPIQIETQSEQQGLTHLHRQRATWGASREFSFDRREQALDQGAAAVKPSWEGTSHLGTHSVYAPGFLPTLGGNHALRSETFANVGVIALAVELRVRQHQPDAGLLGSCVDDGRQIRAVVPRPSPRELRQHELLIQIHGHHPLQPVPPPERLPQRGSTARETSRERQANGRSPTSAIAPPAYIENHAAGQSPSRISMKLLGCQQSQISFSLRLSLCYTTPPVWVASFF